jgi:hypothetical protein
MEIDKQRFEKDGYLVIKNVFTASEIEQMRKDAYEQYEIDGKKNLAFTLPDIPSKARYSKGDLLSKELLSRVLLDERILKIARTILGSDDITYFGDSSYQIGTGLRGFHRDNIDRTDLNGPDWQGEYTLVRMGVYLQDHKNYSGGLKVKTGSHKNADGKATFVDNEVGDVVIWSLKTIHSGNAVRFKWFRNLMLDKAEGSIPEFLKKDQQLERISLFMTFALRSNHLDRYINEYVLKRTETIEHIKSSVYAASTLEQAEQKRVKIYRIPVI